MNENTANTALVILVRFCRYRSLRVLWSGVTALLIAAGTLLAAGVRAAVALGGFAFLFEMACGEYTAYNVRRSPRYQAMYR